MSLIFTERNIELILQGKKTQTRRIWKRIKVKKGGIYKIKRHIFSKKHYGLIQVTDIRKEKLGNITEEDAKKEGYGSVAEFKKVWEEIYGRWNPEQEVYVIEFKLLDGNPPLKERRQESKSI